ncbi:MAG TPA: hypothetical protein RMG48_02725 [Myxococcales bacterium LLY-WYZ-16_1]|nr:hypothetical protein [Myxococcales bacterium LLY-WYZ-16_1]
MSLSRFSLAVVLSGLSGSACGGVEPEPLPEDTCDDDQRVEGFCVFGVDEQRYFCSKPIEERQCDDFEKLFLFSGSLDPSEPTLLAGVSGKGRERQGCLRIEWWFTMSADQRPNTMHKGGYHAWFGWLTNCCIEEELSSRQFEHVDSHDEGPALFTENAVAFSLQDDLDREVFLCTTAARERAPRSLEAKRWVLPAGRTMMVKSDTALGYALDVEFPEAFVPSRLKLYAPRFSNEPFCSRFPPPTVAACAEEYSAAEMKAAYTVFEYSLTDWHMGFVQQVLELL